MRNESIFPELVQGEVARRRADADHEALLREASAPRRALDRSRRTATRSRLSLRVVALGRIVGVAAVVATRLLDR